MSKPKFTPGPWKCTKYPKVFSINAETGRQIAIMTEHHGDCPLVPMHQFERSEQDAADAALISAAPEMYAVLQDYVDDQNGEKILDGMELWHRINSVLAKARGEG